MRVDPLQMFGNTARQLNRNRAIDCLTVITSKLGNLERRVLDGCDVLRRGLGGIHTLGNAPPLDNASLVAINNLDVHRSRIDIEIEVAEHIGIKSRTRKLLRLSGIVTVIQKIALVNHIVPTGQAGYNIVEIPRAIKMNQCPRNAKYKPNNEHKRSDANTQAYLGFMRKLHHSSPSLEIGSAVAAVATSASGSAEVSFPWALIATGAEPT